MLANRARNIVKKIDDFEKQKDREIKLNKYKNLISSLQKEKKRLDNLIEIKYVLGKEIENIALNIVSKNLREIKNSIINDNINEREGAFLRSALDSVESQLKSEWKKHYEYKTRGIIQTLTNIKPFFNDEREIEMIINNLKGFESKWPINRQSYDRFEELINIAKNKINELELTDDIRRFISRITSNNATIEDLTPNILKWINDNKYENKIKLRFK